MKKYLKPFFTAYLLIPFVFYTVDLACQSTFVDGTIPPFIILSIVLIAIMGVTYHLVLHKLGAVQSPYAAAAGGIVGLLHGITPYMMVGTYWVWKTMPYTGFTPEDKETILLSFVNPIISYNDFVCDGSIVAVLVSGLIFGWMSLKAKRRSV